jgi:predicted pyridoxine 5'-phosphate oxidase superfamily flavin-nucleotide-binding protein
MVKLPAEVAQFFQNQGFVIVSTLDNDGTPHNSCKGIVRVSPQGKIYLLDLYQAKTYHNLVNNPRISITAVDEYKFAGYCLKGEAKIVQNKKIGPRITAEWEEKVTSRITQRMIRNIREEKGQSRHPEVSFPKPKYMIVMEVKEIVNLAT